MNGCDRSFMNIKHTSIIHIYNSSRFNFVYIIIGSFRTNCYFVPFYWKIKIDKFNLFELCLDMLIGNSKHVINLKFLWSIFAWQFWLLNICWVGIYSREKFALYAFTANIGFASMKKGILLKVLDFHFSPSLYYNP